MPEIVVVSDVHEGITFGYRLHPETGISDRALDLHRNFVQSAQYAIQKRAPIFIVTGDLFDRTHVSPAFREMVRRDVIEPLGDAGVEVWLLAGNHDQPRSSQRGTSLDDFRGYNHVSVFKDLDIRERIIGSRRVAFFLVPFLHPEQIQERIQKKLGKDLPREAWIEAGRRVLKGWLEKRVKEHDVDFRVMLGHYYVEGARISSVTSPEVLPHEFSFTKDMIPKEIDLAVFGHIHLHQKHGDKIVYVGAPERIDWGERKDPKGFLTIQVDKGTWQFVELPARAMHKIVVQVSKEEDPTEAIRKALPQDIPEALVRLEVHLPEGGRERVKEDQIEKLLAKAFFYEVKWIEQGPEKVGFSEFTMDPTKLFEDFVERNYEKDPRKEEILREGTAVLREVLQ